MTKTFFLASDWRRSTRCESVNCVEAARRGHGVVIRNSNTPDLHLDVSGEAWNAFVAGIRAGQFDRA